MFIHGLQISKQISIAINHFKTSIYQQPNISRILSSLMNSSDIKQCHQRIKHLTLLPSVTKFPNFLIIAIFITNFLIILSFQAWKCPKNGTAVPLSSKALFTSSGNFFLITSPRHQHGQPGRVGIKHSPSQRLNLSLTQVKLQQTCFL